MHYILGIIISVKEKKGNIEFRQDHKLNLPEVHEVDKGIDPNVQPKVRVQQVLNEKPNLIYPHHLINPFYNQQKNQFSSDLKILHSQKQHQMCHFQKVLDLMINSFQYHK